MSEHRINNSLGQEPVSAQLLAVLLVEDNPADVRLIRRGLQDSPVQIQLSVAKDGEEALAIMRRQGKFADAAKPQLVILDLNLPRLNGHEVLRAMRNDANLSSIPVVIFTTSEAEEDIFKSYRLQANVFVTKPFDLENFTTVIQCIVSFGRRVANLPPLYN